MDSCLSIMLCLVKVFSYWHSIICSLDEMSSRDDHESYQSSGCELNLGLVVPTSAISPGGLEFNLGNSHSFLQIIDKLI